MLPLVGREDELDRLRALLLGAKAGEPALALLEGPAGIGKTRLLDELRREAGGDNVRVLTARGSELEAEFSFGVARQLLEASLTDAEDGRGAPLGGLPQARHPVAARAGGRLGRRHLKSSARPRPAGIAYHRRLGRLAVTARARSSAG